jgi:hypothetical protein
MQLNISLSQAGFVVGLPFSHEGMYDFGAQKTMTREVILATSTSDRRCSSSAPLHNLLILGIASRVEPRC